MKKIIPTLLAVCACAAAGAQDMGKLLATGGVSQVEGAGGGGITPWALISGYGTRDSWGANAHYTHLSTQDYKLHTYGVTAGIASGAAMLPYTVIKEANPPEMSGTATGVVNFLNFTFSALLGPVFGSIMAGEMNWNRAGR